VCGGGHLFDGGCACLILDPLGGGVALMRGGGGAYSSGAFNRDDTEYSYTCFFISMTFISTTRLRFVQNICLFSEIL